MGWAATDVSGLMRPVRRHEDRLARLQDHIHRTAAHGSRGPKLRQGPEDASGYGGNGGEGCCVYGL